MQERKSLRLSLSERLQSNIADELQVYFRRNTQYRTRHKSTFKIQEYEKNNKKVFHPSFLLFFLSFLYACMNMFVTCIFACVYIKNILLSALTLCLQVTITYNYLTTRLKRWHYWYIYTNIYYYIFFLTNKLLHLHPVRPE